MNSTQARTVKQRKRKQLTQEKVIKEVDKERAREKKQKHSKQNISRDYLVYKFPEKQAMT
jgi:hypothetical protein